MTEYVAGFLFSADRKHVALIEKQRPAWQRGKWNAIGGHIEESDECPLFAMRREFREETGVSVEQWEYFCTLSGDSWRVHFYRAFSDEAFSIKTVTDETVRLWPLDATLGPDLMTNIPWLVRMALSMDRERAAAFDVREVA